MVGCVQCSRPISARRAACAITHGLCPNCNAPNLLTSKDARERLPEYETASLERASQSYGGPSKLDRATVAR
jgi:hypothetical protein